MLRVRLKLLLLITALLTLLCAELSHIEEPSSIGGRDKVKPASCGKDCEDSARVRRKSTPKAKCELIYFAPTATQDELFGFWNNTLAEQLEAYQTIAGFLQANLHEDKAIFFPAHLPLVEKRDRGRDAMVLKDVYVRAKGTCGDIPEEYDPDYFVTKPKRLKDKVLNPQEEVELLEDYIERMPRSHWGFRVPKAGEEDVCLDDTGLVVKDFPGIRTCFSMWIYDDRDGKPKHFAGRQIYNRINQKLLVNISSIGFDPPRADLRVKPIETEWFSLPALFLKETCNVTNAPLENRCTYWTTNHFYVSLCCCYTNRSECAYRNYKFPSQKTPDDTKIRACATGDYYVVKTFGGNHEPQNASGIASSVKQFVQERTSSEVCMWTYTWNPSNETKLEDVLRVDLDAAKTAAIPGHQRSCASNPNMQCCQRTSTLCPLDANSDTNEIVAECFCSHGDLCNKQRSYLDEKLVKMYKEARPCATHTLYEHLLEDTTAYRNPSTGGYMCPVFYHFALTGRENSFLQLLHANNFEFVEESDHDIFKEHGCHLVEVFINETSDCTEKLFGEHDQPLEEMLPILICAVEGNPLGESRTSYPDAELKKTIEANLTAAKAEFPTCKNGSWSLDFASLSELVLDNNKLFDLYDDRQNGTNDNITTAYCYVEVSFVYQQQYNFTFGTVSFEDKPLRLTCGWSADYKTCVRRNSTAGDEHEHYTCCCGRHWNKPLDMCRDTLFDQLKTLLSENVIAERPEEIMGELKMDPLTKCIEPDKTDTPGQARAEINRPCARNQGCYTGVHARDVPTNKQHKEFTGCVSKYAPDAKKRDDATSVEVEARFYRICRLPRNHGQCFAVLGTEDVDLPDDVKGPQMVCCCGGRVGTAEKCGTSHQFGMRIGDFH